MQPINNPSEHRVLYYGRRKGKPLTAARQDVVERLLPRLKINAPPSGSTLDPQRLFPESIKEIWLEVGEVALELALGLHSLLPGGRLVQLGRHEGGERRKTACARERLKRGGG